MLYVRNTVGIDFCVDNLVDELQLGESPRFSRRLGQLESACATGILNLLNSCSIGHLVDSPRCSATVSLHFHLDDFGLHCVDDWLELCVQNLFNYSLGPVMRRSAVGTVCSPLAA